MGFVAQSRDVPLRQHPTILIAMFDTSDKPTRCTRPFVRRVVTAASASGCGD